MVINTWNWIKSCIENPFKPGFFFYAAPQYPIPWYAEWNQVSILWKERAFPFPVISNPYVRSKKSPIFYSVCGAIRMPNGMFSSFWLGSTVDYAVQYRQTEEKRNSVG